MTAVASSWENEVMDSIRRRNERQTDPFVDIYAAYSVEEKKHRHLEEKHIEIRNQVGVIQHSLQMYQKKNPDEITSELDEMKLLLANLQDDLSARSTKDFDDVKIRIDLENTIKEQKQQLCDSRAEAELLRTELSNANESLANTTSDLHHNQGVVETLQKELDSCRNLLSATEDRLKEVETQNGTILSRLMDEKKTSSNLLNELTKLQESKGNKAVNIIGGGLSYVKKSFFGGNQRHEENFVDKEDDEFIEVEKTNSAEDELESRSSLISEVIVPHQVNKILKCHSSEVNDVTFGARNTFISGGADSYLKIFDMGRATGRLSNVDDPSEIICQDSMHSFSCGGPVISVHSAGMYVAGACGDGIARIWNVRTGNMKQNLSGHANKVTSIRLIGSGDDKAVTGSADRIVRLWDLSRKQANLISNLKTNSCIGAVDACSDCNTICSGHQDGGIRFWNVLTKDRIHFIPKLHKGIVTCVQFDTLNGRHLLCASRDNTISVIDNRTYETMLVLKAPAFSIASDWSQVTFSPDCSMVAAGSSDGHVFLWDALTGELKDKIFSGQSAAMTSVCWKENGFLSCNKEGNVLLWG